MHKHVVMLEVHPKCNFVSTLYDMCITKQVVVIPYDLFLVVAVQCLLGKYFIVDCISECEVLVEGNVLSENCLIYQCYHVLNCGADTGTSESNIVL